MEYGLATETINKYNILISQALNVVYCTPSSTAIVLNNDKNCSFSDRVPTVTRKQSAQCISVPRYRHTTPRSAIP